MDNIPKDVLIGEYACDLLEGRDMVLCKKSDSVMRYSGGGSPKDVFLAPKDFAGYVLLVNTGPKEKCNCISLRLIIDGSVRILLLTSKKIKKG